MVVTRRTFLPLLLIAILLTFGTSSVLAKDKNNDGTSPVNGASMGTSQVTNLTTCNPPSQNANFLVCNFDVMGTYTATTSPLAHAGTYSGNVTLDYHSYNATNHCATASGTITFTNTATGDKLYTMIDPAHSQVCETATATIHSENLVLKITGGTGIFQHASGTIMSNGSTADTGPGTHADSATLTGSITLERGNNGHGCGNDGHNNGHGNDGNDNGDGHCGPDHGNGHGDNGGND